ncbi:MAG: hypothetical protein R2778_04605 [Saprospiraceae bacterium]
MITISHAGYIKRTSITEYRAQGREDAAPRGYVHVTRICRAHVYGNQSPDHYFVYRKWSLLLAERYESAGRR